MCESIEVAPIVVWISCISPFLGRYHKMLIDELNCDTVIPLTHQVCAKMLILFE